MTAANFLCAIDLADPCLLSRRSSLRVRGWIVPKDGTSIDNVLVEINGRGAASAAFPTHRADVQTYYAGVRNAAMAGFVSRRVRLDPQADRKLDVRVVAESKGVRHTVLARQLDIVWFDPRNELFALRGIGPLLFPLEFDPARLVVDRDIAPTFLLIPDGDRAEETLRARGHSIADGHFVLDVLKALVECHDVFHAFRKKYFVHLERDLSAYAIGRFDVYAVMNGLVAQMHKRLCANATGRQPIHALRGRECLLVVPLLLAIYPKARFVCVRQAPASVVRDGLRAGIETARWALINRKVDPDRYQCVWFGKSYATLLRILKREMTARRTGSESPIHDVRRTDRLLAELGLGAERHPLVDGSEIAVNRSAARSSTPAVSTDGANYLAALPRYADPSPIFVLGAGRSGTSAMVGAIKAAGIDGFHEGHVFPMLNEMLARVARLPGEMRAPMLRVIAVKTVEPVYGGEGPRVWVAKTPDHAMIDCVGLIRTIYPRARFVMMRRHPVSFAESRRRKFDEPLLSSINEWIKCIESWKKTRAGLSLSEYLERDVRDLRNPHMNEELAAFLDLDAAQCKRFTDYLATERPEFTRMAAEWLASFAELDDERRFNAKAMFYAMLDSVGEYIEDTEWSSEQKAQVVHALGALPAEFGYRLNRPDNHLLDLLVSWSKQLEQYRYTAEFHEKNALYWVEVAESWRLAAEEGSSQDRQSDNQREDLA